MREPKSLVQISPATRHGHYRMAALTIGLVGLLGTFFTLLLVAASAGSMSFDGVLFGAVSGLGQQVSRDCSFLLPTLLAAEAVLVGIPLAQSRTRSGRSDLLSRQATIATLLSAGTGVTAEVLSAFGAIGNAPAAQRLWSVTILVAVLVSVAFWTTNLVLAVPAEQLLMTEEALTAVETALNHLMETHPQLEVPSPAERTGRKLLRLAGLLLLAVWALNLIVGFAAHWVMLLQGLQEAWPANEFVKVPLNDAFVVALVGVLALLGAVARLTGSKLLTWIPLGASILAWGVSVSVTLQEPTPATVVFTVFLVIPILSSVWPIPQHFRQADQLLMRRAVVRFQMSRLQRLKDLYSHDIENLRRDIGEMQIG